MAKGPKLNGARTDGDTINAPGYAGFMLAQALLAILVRAEAMSHHGAGVLVRETASSIGSSGPVEKAAQRLLLDLAATYSGKSRRPKTQA